MQVCIHAPALFASFIMLANIMAVASIYSLFKNLFMWTVTNSLYTL